MGRLPANLLNAQLPRLTTSMHTEKGIRAVVKSLDPKHREAYGHSETVKEIFRVEESLVQENAAQSRTGGECRDGCADEHRHDRSLFTKTCKAAETTEAAVEMSNLAARLTLLPLNMISLMCIGLAIGVAVFSAALPTVCDTVSIDCAQDMPIFTTNATGGGAAAAAQQQLYRGVNATIWNMEQLARYGMKNAFDSYESASLFVCTVNHSNKHCAGRNARHSFARSSGGYLGDSLRIATLVANMSTTTTPSLSYCEAWLATALGGINTSEPLMRIESITQRARLGLHEIMSRPFAGAVEVPTSNRTAAVHTLESALTTETRTSVAVFLIAATIALIFVSLKEYWLWRHKRESTNNFAGKSKLEIYNKFCGSWDYGGTSASQWISGLLVRSKDGSGALWAKWAMEYSFSSSLSRLLYVACFFCILAIANASLIHSAEEVWSATYARCGKTDTKVSAAITDTLNNDIAALITSLLGDLNSNYNDLLKSLENVTKLAFIMESPFQSGVALEEVGQSLAASPEKGCQCSTRAHVFESLKSLNSAAWKTSMSAFIIWAVCATCACLYANYKTRTETNGDKKTGT